jgi:hypothetical protein
MYDSLKLLAYFTGDGGHKNVMYRAWHTATKGENSKRKHLTALRRRRS